MLSRMGGLISRFRSKPSTREQLEQIDTDIQSIEDYKWTKMRQQKNLMALIFYGGGFLYAVVAIIFYFCFLPMTHNLYDKCLYSLPILVLPAVAYMLQRSIQWYFRWVIESNEDRLRELRKEKRKILDKVMETETYKVAKELLERFDPISLKSDKTDSPAKSPPASNPNLRFRGTMSPQSGTSNQNTPNRSFVGPSQVSQRLNPGMNPATTQRQVLVNQGVSTPRQFVRPILSGERSVVDKLVDYVVGDGPNNRYALICCFCHMHNGMALKYEFEFIAFRCCYCNTYNPPRKVRINAPRIMPPPVEPRIEEPESDIEKTTGDTDSQDGSADQRDVVEASEMPSVGLSSEITRESTNQEESDTPKQDDVSTDSFTDITEDKNAEKKSEIVLED